MHLGSPSDPSRTAAADRVEAEVRIFNFKTTWSEFQWPSQTATEQGKAEMRIINFKTRWSGSITFILPNFDLILQCFIPSPVSVPSSCVP